jgi:septal ring factor EnvC (AmiA/AmiB activator)
MVDFEAFYTEINAQLEQMIRRLDTIERKLDSQAKRDHLHELKIQKLELALENLKKEFFEIKNTVKSIKVDINNMGEKIRNVEQGPDKKKANLVNTILEKTFNYILGVVLAGIAAYLMVRFGTK